MSDKWVLSLKTAGLNEEQANMLLNTAIQFVESCGGMAAGTVQREEVQQSETEPIQPAPEPQPEARQESEWAFPELHRQRKNRPNEHAKAFWDAFRG